MDENPLTVDGPHTGVEAPKSGRRKFAWIAGGTAAAMMLAVAAIGIPQLVRASQPDLSVDYEAVIIETNEILLEGANAEVETAALLALTELHTAAAHDAAKLAVELSKTKAPILASDTATGLLDAAAALVGQLAEHDENAVPRLREVRQASLSADQDISSAETHEEEPVSDSPLLTKFELALTSEDAIQLLELTADTRQEQVLPTDQITREALDEATSYLEQVKVLSVEKTEALAVIAADHDALEEALEGFAVVATEAAETAPAQAAAVVKSAVKADKATKETVTAAAEAAAGAAAEQASVDETLTLLREYVAAAETAQKQHKKAAEKEEAAKQAEAAGETGYTDPSTGVWTPIDSGPGGNPGGGSGGGGGNADGGSNGGAGGGNPGGNSGGGGGAGDGGGYVPPVVPDPPTSAPYVCPDPPHGSYPTGGWYEINGVRCPRYSDYDPGW